MNADEGKQWEWGYCSTYFQRVDILDTELSFNFIHNQCFPRMRDDYSMWGHSCHHWASDFFCQLKNKDPPAYVYGMYG